MTCRASWFWEDIARRRAERSEELSREAQAPLRDSNVAAVDAAGVGVEAGIPIDEVELRAPRLVVGEDPDGVLPESLAQPCCSTARTLLEPDAAFDPGRAEDLDDHGRLGASFPEAAGADLGRAVEVPGDVVLDDACQGLRVCGARPSAGASSGAAADVDPGLAGRHEVAEGPTEPACGCSSGTRHASSIADLEAWRGRHSRRLYVKTVFDAAQRAVIFETCWLPRDFARYLPCFARDPNGHFFAYIRAEDADAEAFTQAMTEIAVAFREALR